MDGIVKNILDEIILKFDELIVIQVKIEKEYIKLNKKDSFSSFLLNKTKGVKDELINFYQYEKINKSYDLLEDYIRNADFGIYFDQPEELKKIILILDELARLNMKLEIIS